MESGICAVCPPDNTSGILPANIHHIQTILKVNTKLEVNTKLQAMNTTVSEEYKTSGDFDPRDKYKTIGEYNTQV